jgi:hypothetical protein
VRWLCFSPKTLLGRTIAGKGPEGEAWGLWPGRDSICSGASIENLNQKGQKRQTSWNCSAWIRLARSTIAGYDGPELFPLDRG